VAADDPGVGGDWCAEARSSSVASHVARNVAVRCWSRGHGAHWCASCCR